MHAPLDREEERKKFRPSIVKVLFVGESPPAAGGFFYFGRGILFTSTQEAFANAWGRPFQTPAEFLRAFVAAGCYLEDLSHAPVDHLSPPDRNRILEACVAGFAQELRDMSPQVVVVFLRRIAPLITRAVAVAGLPRDHLHVLPFPGHGNRPRYVAGLTQLLSDAHARGIIA